MAPTSEERREVAARLRNDGRALTAIDMGVELASLTLDDAIGIEHNATWEECFNRLADLIDPTCKRVSMDAAGNPPFYTGGLALNDVTGGCSVCGYPFGNSFRSIGNPLGVPNYCPCCGARVVDEDD